MRDAYIIREAIEHQLMQELYNKGFSSALPAEIHLDQLTVNPILIRPDSPARSVGYDVANTIAKGFTHIESPKNVP